MTRVRACWLRVLKRWNALRGDVAKPGIPLSNFVFVHSVQLIDLLESRGTFAGMRGHTYVLLGPREKHEQSLASSPNRGKVICAALLPNNIEGMKNLLQFTGWYAIANNPVLGDGVDYVGLYEYDIEVPPEFDGFVRNGLENNPDLDIMGFQAYPKDFMLFDGTSPYCRLITMFLEERLKIPAEDFLLNRTPAFSRWIVTSNVVMRRQRFLEFMWSDYMRDLMKFLDNDSMAGHALERSISLYVMLKGWNACEMSGQLRHIGADSHDTQGHKERFDREYGV